MNDVDPLTPSTRREKKNAVISRLIKRMSPVCSIHNAYYEKLAEEHEFSAVKNLSGRVDLSLANPSYNVQKY